jgi:integrase
MPDRANTGQRRLEGRIEWRGRDTFRVRVHNGFDPVTRKRRYLSATGHGNQKVAERALRDLLSKRDAGLDVQPERLTLAEWLGRWLEGRIADGAVGPRAAENYRVIVKKRIAPAIGDVRLQDLRTDAVLQFKVGLVESGLAPATVNKQLGLLRQGLEAAVSGGLIVRNPASSVGGLSLAGTSTERRALTEDEVAKLLKVAEGSRCDVPMRIALATGIRQSELLGLTWGSLDLEEQTLVVQQTVQHLGGTFRILPPKTQRSRRTIELSRATVALLRQHRAIQNAARLQLGGAWHDLDLVFPAADGKPQYRRVLLQAFRKLVTASGIEHPETVNWHSLRHTAASLWIKGGIDIFTVSRRLGHGKAGFTMDVYGHLLKGQQRAAAEALDHLLSR